MILPKGCQIVGIELTDEAIDLPSFTHPRCAAYVLGPERGSLSDEMRAKCHHIIRIPTKFCIINVQIAGRLLRRPHQTPGCRRARPCYAGAAVSTLDDMWLVNFSFSMLAHRKSQPQP